MQPHHSNYFDVEVLVRTVADRGVRASDAARNRTRPCAKARPAFPRVASDCHVHWLHGEGDAQQHSCPRSSSVARPVPRGSRVPPFSSALPPQGVMSEMPPGLFRCPPNCVGVSRLGGLLLSNAVDSATAGKQRTGVNHFNDTARIHGGENLPRDLIVGIVESAENHRTVAHVVIDV